MRAWAIGAIVLGLAATASAADDKPLREELTDSLYTQGEMLVPVPQHRDAAKNGYIYRFEKQSWERLPVIPKEIADKPEKHSPWLVETMREKKTGDIFYNDGGASAVMLVISGKVRDLGKHFLHDFHDKILEAPTDWPPADPKKGIPFSGWVTNPEPGRVYLIETVDAKHVLFRIVARGKGGIYIQWVSPEQKMTAKWDLRGGITSVADKADVAFYAAEAVATTRSTAVAANTRPVNVVRPLPPTQPKTAPATIIYEPIRPTNTDLGPIPGPDRVAALMRERDALIRDRMGVLSREAKTGREQRLKAQAFVDLGQMGAAEAAETMVAQISFIDPGDSALTGEAIKLHPAVGALIKLGKPGAAAAIKGIHELKPSTNPLTSPTYRTMLLSIVIRRVEGDEVAEFLLKREADKADAEHKQHFEQAIKEIKGAVGGGAP